MDSKDSTWEGIVIPVMSWLVSRMLVALFPSKKWELIATSQENMAKPTEQKKKFSCSSLIQHALYKTQNGGPSRLRYSLHRYSLFIIL